MKCMMVTFEVKDAALGKVNAAIKKFVAEIKRNEPGNLFYYSFGYDRTKFIHVIGFRDEKAEETHRNAAYTKEFVGILYPNCTAEPAFEEINPVAMTEFSASK